MSHDPGQFISRAEWGARSPRGVTPMRDPSGTTAHWEGPGMGDYEPDECAGKVRNIQNYHMRTNGWDDIAYNALVCRHGCVFEGRWWNHRSAANGTNDGNKSSYAICTMIGNGDELTAEAKIGLNTAFRWSREQGGAGGSNWVHSDWFQTACAGPDITAFVRAGLPIDSEGEAMAAFNGAVSATLIPNHRASDGSPGVWVVADDGGVSTYPIDKGWLPFFGSMGGKPLNAPMRDIVATPDAGGYWLIGADGGVFAFGNAQPINVYEAFHKEYADGVHNMVSGQLTGNTLMLIANDGACYAYPVTIPGGQVQATTYVKEHWNSVFAALGAFIAALVLVLVVNVAIDDSEERTDLKNSITQLRQENSSLDNRLGSIETWLDANTPLTTTTTR